MRAKFPSYSVGDVAKELGKRWEVCTNKPKYEQLAAKDRQRYEKVRNTTPAVHLVSKLLLR